jgi:F-type H+-transporting ATPase subunit epsilon
MKLLRLQVLTPLATVFDAPVEAVIAPLADGWVGILPGHARFQARLMRGQVVVRSAGQEQQIATIGGTMSVSGDAVLILTGAAAPDTSVARLEHERGQTVEQREALEREAEKHFDRVYRAMARTFNHRGGRLA